MPLGFRFSPRFIPLPQASFAFALALFSSGCVTQTQYRGLLEQAETREARIVALESGSAEVREDIEAAVREAQAKVDELRQLLEEATEVVTRNSADVGEEVRALDARLALIDGQLDELQHELEQQLQQTRSQLAEQNASMDQRINRLAQRTGVDLSLDDSQIPSDADEHYVAASAAYDQQNFPLCRALYREFVRRHAQDERADDAFFWIGRTYLEERRPANALGAFQRVLSLYPEGDVVDDSLFYMAEAFYHLHACSDAIATLEALIQAHPRSSFSRRARRKLAALRQAPEGYCTS